MISSSDLPLNIPSGLTTQACVGLGSFPDSRWKTPVVLFHGKAAPALKGQCCRGGVLDRLTPTSRPTFLHSKAVPFLVPSVGSK